MSRSLLFVINPRAGRTEGHGKMLDVLDTFIRAGYDVSVRVTQGPQDALHYVAEHGSRFDRVVACGGDGTVNEVLNGLMACDPRPELGIMPTGTMNDYAYNLHIKKNLLESAAVAAGGERFPIDVGRFDDRYFTYVSAFGLFTDVTYETPQTQKNLLGAAAYVLEGAKRLGSIRTFDVQVEHDNGVVAGSYIAGLFTNTVSIAGLRTALTGSRLDDGLLEMVLIKTPSTLNDIQSVINMLLDLQHLPEMPADFVTFLRTKKARVTFKEPVAWTVDGESGGVYQDVVIENVPTPITVLRGEGDE